MQHVTALAHIPGGRGVAGPAPAPLQALCCLRSAGDRYTLCTPPAQRASAEPTPAGLPELLCAGAPARAAPSKPRLRVPGGDGGLCGGGAVPAARGRQGEGARRQPLRPGCGGARPAAAPCAAGGVQRRDRQAVPVAPARRAAQRGACAPPALASRRAAAVGAAAGAAQQALRARPALRVGLYPTLLYHTLQVELETVSGAMDMHFLNADLTNAYAELDNVVLALVPAAGATAPGLLLGAHFDATLDTPGAGLGRRRRARGLRAQRPLRSTRMAQWRVAPAAWSAGCHAVSGKQQCDHAVEGTWRRQHARASLRAASGRQQGCHKRVRRGRARRAGCAARGAAQRRRGDVPAGARARPGLAVFRFSQP